MRQENEIPNFKWAKSSESQIQIDAQVSLRIIGFTPVTDSGNLPIVMVTGLVTQIDSFRNVLADLSKTHPIYYLETREKKSSQINGAVSYDMETMGKDVARIVHTLGLENDRYVFMGYSFGAAVVADGFRYLKSRPLCILFLEPTPVFHYPPWSLFLIRWFGLTFFSVLKSFGIWYLGKFHINKKEDIEMAVISTRSINNADSRKIRNAILAIAGYQVWDRLNEIKCPSLVVGTSKDGLHIEKEVMQMVDMLGSRFIDLETNKRTHSEEMAQITIDYIRDVIQPRESIWSSEFSS